MHVGLNGLFEPELLRHIPESRAFYATRGERRGPASLEELREARAEQVIAPLPRGPPWSTHLTHPGDGSRGGSSMTTLLRLRDRGRPGAFAGAALQFGAYDLSGQTPAGRLIADEYFVEAYAGHVADRTLPDVSPIFGDLRDLPPPLVIVGTSDVLLEDNLAMAARLSAAGGEVDLRVYPESPHGFTGHPTSMARAALTDRDSWLADRVAERVLTQNS